jgi:hypothetical protein
MVNKIVSTNKELEDGTYEIWCDNVVLTELEIITSKGAKRCWLVKAEYDTNGDNYRAIYKPYNTK